MTNLRQEINIIALFLAGGLMKYFLEGIAPYVFKTSKQLGPKWGQANI